MSPSHDPAIMPPPTASLAERLAARRRRSRRALWTFVGATLAIGMAGGLFTAPALKRWYPALRKPPLNPPNGVFAPVWTVLYAMIGTSGWLLWRREPRPKRALVLWGAQLLLNAAWSGIFFGARAPRLALAEIGVLWGTVGAYTISTWRISRGAAAMVVPYWAWLSFAAYLNAGIVALNRPGRSASDRTLARA